MEYSIAPSHYSDEPYLTVWIKKGWTKNKFYFKTPTEMIAVFKKILEGINESFKEIDKEFKKVSQELKLQNNNRKDLIKRLAELN